MLHLLATAIVSDSLLAYPGSRGFVSTPLASATVPDSLDPGSRGFVSRTLGSSMVLQRAPQRAVVWGATAPGTTVRVALLPSGGQVVTAVADASGTWRALLPATPASVGHSLKIVSSAGEESLLTNIAFGDVYLCGGQSNMVFAVPGMTNSTAEAATADSYPHLRIFTVGTATASPVPLRDLLTVREPWQVVSAKTIREDDPPGRTLFSTFSAVCFVFGRTLSDGLARAGELRADGGPVPLGLISNNWGGTTIEQWMPAEAIASCARPCTGGSSSTRLAADQWPQGLKDGAADAAPWEEAELGNGPDSNMYNAMINPYAVGPMAFAGGLWYQGEANTRDAASALSYACLFPLFLRAWRRALPSLQRYFGFAQLSTWCTGRAQDLEAIPLMRDAQLGLRGELHVGWATNADHGFGCDIHPHAKQAVGQRLASSALAIGYGLAVPWESPIYASSSPAAPAADSVSGPRTASLSVSLSGLSARGLELRFPPNYELGLQVPGTARLNCSATDASIGTPQCAWAALQLSGIWFNATVSLAASRAASAGEDATATAALDRMVLTAELPAGFQTRSSLRVEASSYGWGPIPLMGVYDVGTGLPAIPWKRVVESTAGRSAPPLWPRAFSIEATEGRENQLDGRGDEPASRVGYFYDASDEAQIGEMWVRNATGLHAQDGVCQGVDAPCVDLVHKGRRYIIHPTRASAGGAAGGACCLLGTAADGCGALSRDWLRRAGARLASASGLVAGVNADVWAARGGSLNTYAVDAADGTTPVKLVQGAGGRNAFVNLYDTSTFRPVAPPKTMFVPPPSCDMAPKCASQFPCVRSAATRRLFLEKARQGAADDGVS